MNHSVKQNRNLSLTKDTNGFDMTRRGLIKLSLASLAGAVFGVRVVQSFQKPQYVKDVDKSDESKAGPVTNDQKDYLTFDRLKYEFKLIHNSNPYQTINRHSETRHIEA